MATVNSDGLVTSGGGGVAIITATAGDQSATCKVIVNDGTVKDLCSNRYKMITIGKQVWLDGNFRCNKYDTESGLYGDECPVFVTDEQGAKSKTFNRYCVDASNKENWDSDEYAMNLTQDQVNQLGYLYNWSAAMALSAEEAQAQTVPFEDIRQGICPNGWHVPTNEDWEELIEHGGGGSTGSYLKTTTGWYNNGDGEDRFGFAALPVDVADGSTVDYVGRYASFWTATPFTVDGTKVFYRRIDYNWGSLALSNYPKDVAIAVRCLKNPEEDPEE
ncbi:MAG: fibrobacter succinogenes major paralogous domain-containing protein [Paludibacteraceae bacterium]|nr:fibrobacter succinogenes major paralogous domain-containing protein [Paludibacteraceae bacterium]